MSRGRRRVVSPVLAHEVQAGGLHPTDARAHDELPKCYRPGANYAVTFRSSSFTHYVMRELTELDRERILQAEAEHRAAAETVKRFLRRHPEPDVPWLHEFCVMVRRSRDAAQRL